MSTARRGRIAPSTVAIAVAAVGGLLLALTARGPIWRELVEASARAGFWTVVACVAARLGAGLTGSRLSGASHVIWDGAAGLPALMASWLLVGLVPGGFSRGPILAVLAGGALIAVLLDSRDRVTAASRVGAQPSGIPVVLAAGLFAAIAVAGLAWDRVPPVFFDTLTYHWAQPQLWLIHGRIAPVTWSVHSWYPPGMSVLYGVGLGLGGERLANDANLLMALGLSGMAWDLGRRRFGVGGGLAAVGALVTFPIVIHAVGIPAADLGHGMFAAGCLAALTMSGGDDVSTWRRRAAWLAGGAVSTKFLGLVVPLALGAAWIAVGRHPAERAVPGGRRVLRALWFVLPAMLLAAPWFAADAYVTGNPVAPAASSLMPPAGLADGGAAAFRADARGGWPTIAEFPVIVHRLFGGNRADSPFYPAPAWGLMPVVLLLALPLASRDARSPDLLGLAVVVSALWGLTYRWERFLIAATFLIAVALGGGLASAWRRGGIHRLAPVLAVLLGAASAIDSFARVAAFTGGSAVAWGREDAKAFFDRSFAAPRVVRAAAERLDRPETRILFVGENRHYGFDVDRVAPTSFNVHPLVEVMATAHDPAAVRAELRRRGFTHLLIDPGWIERSGRSYPSLAPLVADPAPFSALVRSLGAPWSNDGGVALYEIVP